jgi:hypothetical protein
LQLQRKAGAAAVIHLTHSLSMARSWAATVLNSKRAIEMSVFVVRAFVRMREMLAKNRQLAAKINELDRRLETHDTAIQDIIEAIKELMVPEGPSKRKIGFQLPPGKS